MAGGRHDAHQETAKKPLHRGCCIWPYSPNGSHQLPARSQQRPPTASRQQSSIPAAAAAAAAIATHLNLLCNAGSSQHRHALHGCLVGAPAGEASSQLKVRAVVPGSEQEDPQQEP